MHSDSVGTVDFPTLGDLLDAWVEQHCRVPDGFSRGKPFRKYDWQFWVIANHYRVREDARWIPERPLLNQAFVYRRSLIVGPQKSGKGPDAATIVAAEAVGPTVFGGWAKAGDVYDCERDGHCPCGWYFEYEPGEPKGIRHPSPLIQLTATSQEQVDNVYRPLVSMIHLGPLKHSLKPRENFIRIVGSSDDPEMDRIDAVTSSALSRLGNPISFALQDETGTYTTTNKMRKVAETQRRGAAGMGGRTMEHTNAWDPAENSVAQATFEAQAEDVFKFYRVPLAQLRFSDKRQRRKIFEHVYAGSDHVNIDSIEAEAEELLETDPGQAERFFGNRVVAGLNAYLDRAALVAWERSLVDRAAPSSGPVCLAFDGSDSDDWTSIRAETMDGFQFTPRVGPDGRPSVWNPAEFGGRVPRGEVDAAVDELFDRFNVVRFYCDPPDWTTEIEGWALRHGEAVTEWATYRVTQMHAVLQRFLTDLQSDRLMRDGCPIATTHLQNARKIAKPGQRYILGKPTQHQKIDHAMTSTLVHEAVCDALADGWTSEPQDRRVIVFR